jgi:ankyrin repeat protein
VNELGADVNQRLRDGTTPLLLAAKNGRLDVVCCLAKELGANVNQANAHGVTPLHRAAGNAHLDVVCCLVKELGADVNQADQDGVTPLYIASRKGHLTLVRCLIKDFGADVHQADQDGVSPLFITAYQGNLRVVHWLLVEGGASVDDIYGSQGFTLWNTLNSLWNAYDVAEMTSLLQTMVLLANAPLSFIAKLSHQHAKLWKRGKFLRTQLPVYRDLQSAYIATVCPLPGVLQPLVAEYAAPTSEDIWTDGLRL